MGNESTDLQGSFQPPHQQPNMPPAGGPGYGPDYPPPGQFTPPPVKSGAGKALALTALILAIISLLLCWIPVVNNLVFFLGLLALGFGIAALVVSVRQRSAGKGMSIIALIIAVLSIVGVLASQAFYISLLDDVSKSISESADGVVDAPEKEQKKAAAQALAIGTEAKVGKEYEVAVTGINTNAADALATANEFNEPAKGRYVLVDVAVKYVGAEEGDPWIDLAVKFVGSDARQYDTSTCTAVVEKMGFDVPTLENGGTGNYQVCMDVPAEAATGAKVYVEPLISFDGDSRVYWNAN